GSGSENFLHHRTLPQLPKCPGLCLEDRRKDTARNARKALAQDCAEETSKRACYETCKGQPALTGAALGQNPLQGAAMHVEASRRLRDIVATEFIDALDMLPAHAIR